MKDLVPVERITSKIYLIRGQKVMLDRDLAELYGAATKVLKQAVRRNSKRFPEDFMFELSGEEFKNWRSQFVTSKSDRMGLRYKPMAFTGVILFEPRCTVQLFIECLCVLFSADFMQGRVLVSIAIEDVGGHVSEKSAHVAKRFDDRHAMCFPVQQPNLGTEHGSEIAPGSSVKDGVRASAVATCGSILDEVFWRAVAVQIDANNENLAFWRIDP
jgi:hypothetical protein